MAPFVTVSVLGLLIGSFLNVCILRLPRGESIVAPRSRCPHCHTQLPWWANVPVASYLALRGRCAFCSVPISPRYLLVELLTAFLFALAYWRFGPTSQGLIAAAFTCALIVITFIDIDHRIIPDVISLPGIAIGFAISWLPGGVTPASSAGGILLGGGVFAAIASLYAWWTGRGGLGLGDVKLLAMIGAFLGWTAIPSTILIASVAGSAIGIPAILMRGRHLRPRDGLRAGAIVTVASAAFLWLVEWLATPGRHVALPQPQAIAAAVAIGVLVGLFATVRLAARRFPIPFGPFLAIAALLCFFLDPEAITWLFPWA